MRDEEAPVPPGLAHVFTIRAEIDAPRTNGPGVNGERKHIAITGGSVEGPRLAGRILPGGSDWLWQRPDGVAEIRAHYTVEARDGALIYVRYLGLRVAPDDVREKMIAGEPVNPPAFYFRSSPVFDAPDGPHRWLRETIFVARLAPQAGGVVIEVFSVA